MILRTSKFLISIKWNTFSCHNLWEESLHQTPKKDQKNNHDCRLNPEPAACETDFVALLSDSELLSFQLVAAATGHLSTLTPLFERVRTYTSQLLLISSHHLTPLLHLRLPDMAFSVTLDQVGSLLSTKCSQTAERLYFLLLRIKLYEDCQRLFDSTLRRSGSQHEWFQHVLKCPIVYCKQNRAA